VQMQVNESRSFHAEGYSNLEREFLLRVDFIGALVDSGCTINFVSRNPHLRKEREEYPSKIQLIA
jgi:hypothetical protein